jgi:hypothetical protein
MAQGERFCRACGRDSAAPAPTVPPAQFGATPVSGEPAETSGKAIISLICGLFFFFFPASIVAIIFGHLSLSEIKKSAGRLGGQGLAVAGLVLGYAGVAIIPVVLIIAAIAIPNLLKARMAANEASAVANVHALVSAEINFASNHAQAVYRLRPRVSRLGCNSWARLAATIYSSRMDPRPVRRDCAVRDCKESSAISV